MTFEIFEYIYCLKLSLFPGVKLSHKIFIIAYNVLSNNIYVYIIYVIIILRACEFFQKYLKWF